jgi:uncharacterized protein (DUF1330 family)
MPVYAIALIQIDDREGYASYEAGFMDIFARYGGRLLSVDEAPVVKEGTWPYTRTVLLEFDSNDAFERWYHSDEYQALAQHRFNASSASIAVVQALSG